MAFDAQGNYIPDQMSMTGPQGVTGSGFFSTQMPVAPTGVAPATTGMNVPNMFTGGPSTGQVAGGLALGGLASGNFNLGDFGSTLGSYYESEQALKGAQQLGQAALGTAGALGQQAVQASQFKPFTVTSSLARAGTTPEGGYALELSPQQQALQEQLLGQAQGLFGQVGQDPAAQQAALYEQIRAVQRPEEERQQALMQERLFAGGRGGLQTAQYGGSPEQFAFEKARQEAMAGASLSARQQALTEQQQALAGAQGLLGAGYTPQQRALEALGFGTDIANIAGTSQRAGAQLQSQLGQTGLESYLQAAKIAADRDFAQKQMLSQAGQGLISGLSQPSGGGFDYGGILSSLFKPSESAAPAYASDNWLGGSGFLSSLVGMTPSAPIASTPSQIDISGLLTGASTSPQVATDASEIDITKYLNYP